MNSSLLSLGAFDFNKIRKSTPVFRHLERISTIVGIALAVIYFSSKFGETRPIKVGQLWAMDRSFATAGAMFTNRYVTLNYTDPTSPTSSGPGEFRIMGIVFIRHWYSGQMLDLRISVWVFALLFLSPGLVRSASEFFRRRYRVRRALCATCGYDVRSVTSMRCPECGNALQAGRQRDTTTAPGPEAHSHRSIESLAGSMSPDPELDRIFQEMRQIDPELWR